MIAVRITNKRYVKERMARDDARFFATYGASIQARGTSREFDVIAATIRRPDRLPAVLKSLQQLRPDLHFEVIDWRGLDDNGIVYTPVSIEQAIELARSTDYIKEPPADPPASLRRVSDDDAAWLRA